ncbi:MAG: cytidylate kinase family protein [Methylococcaceae bacterium]|nr:cytidylate kinase family protein [Methylococcaceae bacterium]
MAIITITGDLASGKSLVAKKIAKELGAVYFSTGLIQREIASKYAMTTLELNQYSETHPEIDREIDDRVRTLSDRNTDLVVDSRMAWHFLPHSFKVFLSTNIVRAAERVIADTERSSEPVYKNHNDAMLKLQARKRSENRRYMQLYNADCSSMTNFNLVVDTTHSVPDDSIRTILSGFADWRRNQPIHRFWYSPRSILPLCSLGQINADSSLVKETVQVLLCKGDLYAYAGYSRLVNALNEQCPYVPVDVVATDGERVPEGRSAMQFIEGAHRAYIVSEWEQEFGFEYLALSGRFGERSG